MNSSNLVSRQRPSHSMRIHRHLVILRWSQRILIATFMILFGLNTTRATTNATSDQSGNLLWGALLTFIFAGISIWLVKIGLRKAIFDDSEQELGLVKMPDDLWTAPALANSPVIRFGAVMSDSSFEYQVSGTDWTLAIITDEMQSSQLFKSDSTKFSLEYLVLSIPLNAHVPHIFIDGTRQNSFSKSQDMWSLNRKLSKKNRLQDLEGDFYKFFNVYTANQDYIAALSILTPDVMLAMRDKGYEFDYELYDDHLYVMRDARLNSTRDLRDFLSAAQSCLDELVPQITKHSYDQPLTVLPMHKASVSALAYVYSARIMLTKFVMVCIYVLVGIVLAEIFFMN